MRKKIFQIANITIYWTFLALFFLVPLIFSPLNYELFEIPKMYLVYFLAAIILTAWAIKMICAKRLIFNRSFWDLPLFLFLISQILSTVFSMDSHTSLWSYYTRANGGILSTISYLTLYWSFVSNLDTKSSKKILIITLISGFLVSSYGILEHFGIDKNYWAQDVQNRVFSTLGQPNWLAAYLTTLIFLPIALALTKNKAKNFLILYSLFFILLYSCLLFTKSRSGLLGFAVSFIFFWAIAFLTKAKTKKFLTKFFVFTAIVLVLSLLVKNPVQEKLIKSKPAPLPPGIHISKSTNIRKIVWQGAVKIWQAYPVFGSGVETFAYSYYNHRPMEHNLVSEWDFLYNKAHNEYLNFLATTGAVGLGAYLILISVFLFWGLRQIRTGSFALLRSSQDDKEKGCHSESRSANWRTTEESRRQTSKNLQLALHAGWISILVTNFFGFSVVVTNLLFFLFPALFFVVSKKNQPKISVAKKPLQKAQLIAICLVAGLELFINYNLVKFWYTDTLYAKAENYYNHDYYQQAFHLNQKTVKLRPKEPVYHDRLALTSAALSQIAFEQDQATASAQLADLTIQESNRALKINPFHLNFWKNRIRAFLRLSEINPEYENVVEQAFAQAQKLAPTDAKISYNLALFYKKTDRIDKAIKTLKKTLKMKPNYKKARYSLALYLQEQNQTVQALDQLNYIIKNLDPTDENIKELIEQWEKGL